MFFTVVSIQGRLGSGARPKGGCSGLRDALASRRWSRIGESDPDKRKVGHKIL